ncbi:hypothetical protein D6745_02855 [Candidatus Woesearchaeota archaeon]|nr:MAG: hypothetical protein D6745_02855 [Candidatus Woesearchaeota archaeon]
MKVIQLGLAKRIGIYLLGFGIGLYVGKGGCAKTEAHQNSCQKILSYEDLSRETYLVKGTLESKLIENEAKN